MITKFKSQHAAIAVKLERYFAKEAEIRQKAGVKIDENLGINLSQGSKGRAKEHAAVALNTSPSYVSDAKKLAAENPDLFTQVASGEINIPEENPPAKMQEGSKGESAEQAAKVLKISQRYVHYAKKLEKDAPDLFEQVKKGEINLSQAKQLLKKRTLEAVKSERQKEVQTVEKRAFFYLQPAAEFLPRFEAESVDLLLTDPPYSTDIDDVPSFIRSWMPSALSKIKPTGRAFVCIGAYPQEQSDYLIFLLNETDWIVDNPLIWTYRNTLGVTPKMKYNLNYQVILHLYRDSSNPLDTSITNEMFSVQDINAPDGRQNDRFHEWQKPDELAARLIRHTTKQDDVIIDPFACTGTFLEAAAKLNRTAFGCDTNPASLDIIREYRCLIQL
jgi:DNA modification methylase